MVATMTERKVPKEKNVPEDLFDDEPIIDLVDEVKIETDRQLNLSSSKSKGRSYSGADKSPVSGGNEDKIIFEENTNTSMPHGSLTKRNRQDAERGDRIAMTDRAGSESHGDEELFIMDDSRGAADGQSAAIIHDDAIEMAGDDFRDQFDQNNELDYEIEDEEIDFFPDDDDHIRDDDIIPMPSELTQTFDQDGDVKNRLPDIDNLHGTNEKIKPLAESQDNEFDSLDDIIEITEFDQHFPEIDEESLENADFLNTSDLKDEDFLELFDIGDEDSEAEEDMKALGASKEEVEAAETSRFFDDPLVENLEIGNDITQADEKFSEMDPDLAVTAASFTSAGNFDRPDPQFSHVSNNEIEPGMPKKSSTPNAEDLPTVSTEQIDQAIERIINEKLAGRIEHIIYEIIEKTVKKEIDKLKESLLNDSFPEDDL
jgi:hypothetical protein